MLTTLAALWKCYDRFQILSAVAAPLYNEGSARLFFEDPEVSAYIEAHVTDYHKARGASIAYSLSIDAYSGKSLAFTMILTGAAKYIDKYPNGEPMPTKDGCPIPVWTSPATSLKCSVESVPNDGSLPFPAETVTAQILRGKISRSEAGFMFTEINTSTSDRIAASSGKRTYFSIPGIGTTYLPKKYRDTYLKLGTTKAGYVPATLGVAVVYDKLQPSERIENIVPTPLELDRLSWLKQDAALIKAYGSIVDVVVEEQSQRELFLIALIVGFAASLLPIQTTLIFTLIRKLIGGTAVH